MLDVAEMGKEELEDALRRMDTEKDDTERKVKEIQSYREEMEIENRRAYRQFESMREKFNPNDRKIMSLIDEGEEHLNALQKNESEMSESVQNFQRKKQTEWDMREEDIYLQMNRLEEQEREEKEYEPRR